MDKSARTGREKLRELEELMSGTGIFSEDFSCGLGDFLEVDDGQNPENPKPLDDENGELPKPKPGKDPFPAVDGPLSASEFVARYKKAILSRQGVFRDMHSKWVAASPATGLKLVLITLIFFCGIGIMTFSHHGHMAEESQPLWTEE